MALKVAFKLHECKTRGTTKPRKLKTLHLTVTQQVISARFADRAEQKLEAYCFLSFRASGLGFRKSGCIA